MTAVRRRTAWIALAAANALFLLLLADRDGYEGDDLNSIVPAFHLDAVKQGLLIAYRYAWQPLSYETAALVYRLTGSPDAMFLTAPLAVAVALPLIALAARRLSGQGWLAVAAAMLAMPELWFTGLYYNSSALALPFAAGALLIVASRVDAAAMLMAGVLGGIAVLMRLDFVLACPMLAALLWWRGGGVRPALWLAGGVCAALALGWAAGIVDPAAVLDSYRASTAEIAAKANAGGWDRGVKLRVLTVVLSPIGWAVLLAGVPLWLAGLPRRRWPALLVVGLAALPLLLPLKDLLSPKYALPLLIALPGLLACGLAALEARLRMPVAAAVLVLDIFLLLVSFTPRGRPPFIDVGLAPSRPIASHDGMRSFGGTLWVMSGMAGGVMNTSAVPVGARLHRELLSGRPCDLLLVGEENVFEPGGAAWRVLQLGLVRDGFAGRVDGRGRLSLDLPCGTVRLATPEAATGLSGRRVELRDR